MRISDWSSDVCSSDLLVFAHLDPGIYTDPEGVHDACRGLSTQMAAHMRDEAPVEPAHPETARIGRPDEIFRERVASGPWMVESLQHQISIHWRQGRRSEEHTSELQSLMRISYAVFCLQTKKKK